MFGSPNGDVLGMDGPIAEALLRAGRYLRRVETSGDLRSVYKVGGRGSDAFQRAQWSHDAVVRSTHGVNCTGSCSWKVYVKDGIITWEEQQTDYPSTGPDRPEYEPRGCPRGAAFSWYTYSPTRVRYPYVRGVLLEMYRAAKAEFGDPVLAWEHLTDDPMKRRAYQKARGRGGFVRAGWDEAVEMIAAAHVHIIKRYGPDRIAGFSPIPAMSMASYAAGSRFFSLIGGVMLSFYDWYADLPVASPQVFGDQTDVPESADWWDASYLLVWGSNVPVTRTPDAHWMVEARYRGQKVVVVSPDFSDTVKLGDEWLPAQPGTDGALAMSMGHVILREFFVDRTVPRFVDYAKRFTDLPFLVTLRQEGEAYVADKFLTDDGSDGEASFKTVMYDRKTGPVVPNGSLGFRFAKSGIGKWNLDLGDIDPLLTLYDDATEMVAVTMPRFDVTGVLPRGVPARRIGEHLVTTVFDLLLAQYGVARPGLAGQWPLSYSDTDQPYTPGWQEAITSVPAEAAARVAREFARNAEESGGRSMIIMGSGCNHWFHSDTIYRSFLALLKLTGCQGINGGGWAHYVGQEKVRPLTGWSQLAFGLDWARPARQQAATPYWYMHTNQWRYDTFTADAFASPTGRQRFEGRTVADLIAQSARLGWMPSYPTFNRNPLDLADEADDPVAHVIARLKDGTLRFAADDPDAPENWPRALTVWRANLLGSSGKGHEYFLRHLLGTDSAVRGEPVGQAPEGKLDLLLALDFRMTSTTMFADVVLPAATWYEKHDLSSTDLHPYVHAFNPAIAPPWQTRTDFAAFAAIAKSFSAMAKTHLGVRRDIVAAPLMHDTPDELATVHGIVKDWRSGECEPVPGLTMPRLIVVQRDYPAVADRMAALGPLVESLGATTKGVRYELSREVEYLGRHNGVAREGAAAGRPSLARDTDLCEAILALSGTTNGDVAAAGFAELERRTGTPLMDLKSHGRVTFADTQQGPVPVGTSPEWSGIETGGRRYSPFTMNVERLKPWHTLTGRQHFFLDHDWMTEMGEQLPIYRPPLDMNQLFKEPVIGEQGELGLTVRYLTPHSKWSIHSEYQDNLVMLTLSRGGPTIWISPIDAERIGVRDNDWVEAVNRNGVLVARATVSHRMPSGTVYLYHAQDRLVGVPKSETTGKRGGAHNSLTRVLIKPSHLVGGYAQLSFAFNYLGPTGNQRDEVTMIRRRSQEVEY
ncbi:nitrate reductase subunit alpha [Rhizocola hellebori]|uniref:nitrate reductase (quinone) n=1 Tax=Rhizocola hellebori TaxID=1392758 RepID=A0A8J3Q591_9ACTN|nr:nitrate reductase subunit alpha [Rhizocola hellebori]GIH03664.1 nitrate reductase subunit alpha [Rhizocola hellebori]